MIVIKLELSAIKAFHFFIRSSGQEFNWKSHFRMTPLKAHLMCERKALNQSCGFNVTTSSRFRSFAYKFFFLCLRLSHSKIVKPKRRRKTMEFLNFPLSERFEQRIVKIVEEFSFNYPVSDKLFGQFIFKLFRVLVLPLSWTLVEH